MGRFYSASSMLEGFQAPAGSSSPTFVSATGYETGIVTVASWTPFTGLDLSNCDLAVFILSRDGGVLSSGDSTASSGWQVNEDATSGGEVTSTVFYKVDPTASEELAITFDALGEQASGILVRVNGANTFASSSPATGSSTNADPAILEEFDPPVSALVIAVASWDNVITPSAAPSGYGNLTTQAASGAFGASTAIATKTIAALVSEDPAAFTSGAEQWAAWALGCYQS